MVSYSDSAIPPMRPCLPSRAALFSGCLGIRNGVTCHDGPASQMRFAGRGHTYDPDRPMWMRALQEAGWETACFSGFGQRHLAWWFFAGFTQNFGNGLPGGTESADEVIAKVRPWLRANGAADNWFLHVNYWDVHTPYWPPASYVARMRGQPAPPYPGPDDVAHDAHAYYGPATARDWWHDAGWRNPRRADTVAMPDGNIETYEAYLGFLDGYDAGIAYVDDTVGALLEELDRLGVRDETAIIVGGDHGEAIGELGMYFEHGNCCEGVTRVPLIVNWPGMAGRGTVDALAYQLDLPPTVLDLLGMDVPSGWDGQSLAAAVRGDGVPPGQDHLILGVWDLLLPARGAHAAVPAYPHDPSGTIPHAPLYLFDMAADPGQTHNLAAEQPDIVAALDHLLLDWTYRHTTGPAGVRDPFQEQLGAGVDPDLYCARATIEQRLIDLGRDDQLADLRRRRDVWPPLRPW